MKIVIVGAGVSGLSLYLQLRKVLPNFDSHTVHVYEPSRVRNIITSKGRNGKIFSGVKILTDSTAVVGNTIALAPNSMRLLKYIDNRLYKIFKTRGYVNQSYTFKTARGHTLAIASTGEKGSCEEGTISCPRYNLRDCLHEIVGEDKIQYRRVIDVDLSGKRPVVKFADGGEEFADLVVGADGVRSVVKNAIFGEANEHEYGPHYEGLCGVGAFIDTEIPPAVTEHESMVFTFGPAGSFGYCSAAPTSQRKLGWWSNWGRCTIPDQNVLDTEEIRQQLRERHGTWQDPVIQKVIKEMTTDRVYPIWTTPDLPHWGQSGAVLLGDAAHTFQATSGQGAGQALEDSVTFSLLLAHYAALSQAVDDKMSVEEGIELAVKALYEIRNPRVAMIRDRARNLYLTNKRINSIFLEYVYYFFIYVCTRFPLLGQLIIGNVFKELDEWDSEEEVRHYLKRKGR